MIKFIERKENVLLTPSMFVLLDANRCNVFNKEECSEKSYTEKECISFTNRVKRMKTNLKNNSYLNCCELKVFRFGNKDYLTDGQSRYFSIIKLNQEYINKCNKQNIPINKDNLIKVPIIFYSVDSMEEMTNATIELNSHQKCWTKAEKVRAAQFLTEDGKNIYKLLCKIQVKTGMNQSNALDTLFGQGSCKQEAKTNIDNVREYALPFVDFLIDLQNSCRSKGWNNNDIKSLVHQKCLEVLRDNIFKPIFETKNKKLISYVTDVLINNISNTAETYRANEFSPKINKKTMLKITFASYFRLNTEMNNIVRQVIKL